MSRLAKPSESTIGAQIAAATETLVPYTGATGDLNLGAHAVISSSGTFSTSATLNGSTITAWPTGNAPGGSSGQIQTNNGDGTFGATTAVTVSGSDTALAGDLTNSGGSGVTWNLGGGTLLIAGGSVHTPFIADYGYGLYIEPNNVIVIGGFDANHDQFSPHIEIQQPSDFYATADFHGNSLNLNGTAATVTSTSGGDVTISSGSMTSTGFAYFNQGQAVGTMGGTDPAPNVFFGLKVFSLPNAIAAGGWSSFGYLTLAPLNTGTTPGTVDGQIVRDSTTGSLAVWQAGAATWSIQ